MGIPWLFWLLTCCYRSFKPCFEEEPNFAMGFNQVLSNAAVSSRGATATATTKSRGNTTGSVRRVHFGAVIVVGEDSDISGHGEVLGNEGSGEP